MKKILIAIFALLLTYFYIATKESRIVNNSELKNYTFSPKIVEVTAPQSGLSAYLFEENSNPIVSINATFVGAGNAQNNITNFLSATLSDNKELQEELEINGISLNFGAGLDEFNLSIVAPKKSLDKAIELFVKTFYQPNISNAAINKTKEQMLLALKRQLEHPASVLSLEFNKELYGSHPYGKNPLGTETEIKNANKKEMLAYLKTAFAKDNIIVAIAGDVNEADAQNIIDKMFNKLPEMTKIKPIKDAELNQVDEFVDHKSAQNIAIFATPISDRKAKDFYPLYLANYILGGSGLNSKLSQSIREDNGLAYSVYSYLSYNDKANVAIMSFSTDKENYAKATQLFEDEINNFNVSNTDLTLAKMALINANNLRFAKISDISSFLIYIQKEDLGIDFLTKRNSFIKNVNKEDVNNAIKKYYDINSFRKMSIGEQ